MAKLNKGSITRKNVIEKSLQLFSVKGYYNTSINDILDATNLTKGGLYGHFRSKEDIWYDVYGEAVEIWHDIVFESIRDFDDPVERIEVIIDRSMDNYLGSDIFEGGCFFLNMLVELSGQSEKMCTKILKGYVRFSKLIRDWLKEAAEKKLLKPGLDYQEISSFIIISLNGASALYTSSRDPEIWKQTTRQLKFYLEQLKN